MKIKRIHIIFIIFIIFSFYACQEQFDPKVNSSKVALVVEGLLTDEAIPYYVKLSIALQYDKANSNPTVGNAKVSISDDCGDIYELQESDSGVYSTNPAEFVGKPGNSYSLHVETSDGNVYESSPQLLLPNDFDVKSYAEYSSQDNLVDDGLGNFRKVTTTGVDLLADIKNNSDTVPHFRFQPIIYSEYTYTYPISRLLAYKYFCWDINLHYDLVNITDEKYQTSSKDIQKHIVSFIPDVHDLFIDYIDSVYKRHSIINAQVVNRIIKVSRYRINNETYQFYKNVNSILSAQGKIYDPVALQLQGNMKCITDPQKLVLGFFEASSVRSNIYYIEPLENIVHQIQSYNPSPPTGCIGVIMIVEPPTTPLPPDFWVK